MAFSGMAGSSKEDMLVSLATLALHDGGKDITVGCLVSPPLLLSPIPLLLSSSPPPLPSSSPPPRPLCVNPPIQPLVSNLARVFCCVTGRQHQRPRDCVWQRGGLLLGCPLLRPHERQEH